MTGKGRGVSRQEAVKRYKVLGAEGEAWERKGYGEKAFREGKKSTLRQVKRSKRRGAREQQRNMEMKS